MQRTGIHLKALATMAAAVVALALLGGAALAAIQPAALGSLAHGGVKGDLIGAAATYIGVTAEELRAELGAGKTLAQVATEHGRTRDGLVAALTDAANGAIDQKLADGDITAERAAELKAAVPARVERIVDSTAPLRGAGCRERDSDDSNGSSRFSPERDVAARANAIFGRTAFARP